MKILMEIVAAAVILYFVSGELIGNLKLAAEQYNLSQEFLGIILIPLLGNIGENFSAILCAVKNKVNLSLEIAIGSSIQISLFVTPLLIIFSFMKGITMTYLFSGFQIVICVIAVLMSLLVFQDGKTYWFEGAVLIAVYMVVILAYYYMV
jgi:Ca2+:H+ antiporter